MSEDNSRFRGGQTHLGKRFKSIAFSVQLSSLLDQWSPEEKPSKSARNAARLSLQDATKFPDMSLDVVHLSPGFAHTIQVDFAQVSCQPEPSKKIANKTMRF